MADLISRAAAIDAIISETIDKVCKASPSEDNGWVGGIRDAINAVEEVNAVDAAPVVHGRWKTVKAGASNNYPFWDSKCSECGYTTAITVTGWRYCPCCGAKMDKEEA